MENCTVYTEEKQSEENVGGIRLRKNIKNKFQFETCHARIRRDQWGRGGKKVLDFRGREREVDRSVCEKERGDIVLCFWKDYMSEIYPPPSKFPYCLISYKSLTLLYRAKNTIPKFVVIHKCTFFAISNLGGKFNTKIHWYFLFGGIFNTKIQWYFLFGGEMDTKIHCYLLYDSLFTYTKLPYTRR